MNNLIELDLLRAGERRLMSATRTFFLSYESKRQTKSTETQKAERRKLLFVRQSETPISESQGEMLFFGQPLVCLVCLERKKNDIVAAAFLCISVQKAASADFPERTGTSSPPHRAVGVHTLRLDSAVF